MTLGPEKRAEEVETNIFSSLFMTCYGSKKLLQSMRGEKGISPRKAFKETF